MSRLRSLWTARVAALLALSLSVFLLWMKATGRISSVAGCGDDDGCAQVLGGRWSVWFGIPVSAGAGAVYLVALALSVGQLSKSKTANLLLVASAWTVLFAAVWFLGLLVFVEKAICPYCIAAHALGIVFAVAVLVHFRGESEPSRLSGASFAFLAFGLLVAGQFLGPKPDTHLVTGEGAKATSPNAAGIPAENRRVEFGNGKIAFATDEHPWIGNPSAPHVVAEYFDYTCKSCRDMFGDLHALMEKHPDGFLIFLAPCPLNAACNPHFTGNSSRHPHACELSRISLALWRTKREVFPEFHQWLMKQPLPIRPGDAQARAAEMSGDAAALETAMGDPWIGTQLDAAMANYAIMKAANPKMPKLLLGGSAVMHGIARDTATFVGYLEKHFSL